MAHPETPTTLPEDATLQQKSRFIEEKAASIYTYLTSTAVTKSDFPKVQEEIAKLKTFVEGAGFPRDPRGSKAEYDPREYKETAECTQEALHYFFVRPLETLEAYTRSRVLNGTGNGTELIDTPTGVQFRILSSVSRDVSQRISETMGL